LFNNRWINQTASNNGNYLLAQFIFIPAQTRNTLNQTRQLINCYSTIYYYLPQAKAKALPVPHGGRAIDNHYFKSTE
jgi:hypothetical protein